MKKYVLCVIIVILLLQGCAKNYKAEELKTDLIHKQETTTPTPTLEPTPSPEPTPTPTPEPELVLPQATNDSGKVRIQTASISTTHPYTSYVISSVKGENVVVDPTAMPPINVVDFKPVAIISTHPHNDHVDSVFTRSYDCHKLYYEKGEIQTNDFNIYTILSSHSNDIIKEANQNVIIVLEVDGLRIAHMGDIGQTELTEEQLTDLGEIDIAFMQFENSYSSMTLKNEKGFYLIEQLNPTIVIPTHYSLNALPILEEKYGAITKIENKLDINKEDLPEGPMNVYIISNEYKYF
ncbi:MAG: hypothetical protein GX129_12250 [Clostridiales bacterium]|jgi:L-ascorbate metabolism protein UlaG (beta-lactamase superfamily)|nr:hypothetical protein [Clostridiales bacterium]